MIYPVKYYVWTTNNNPLDEMKRQRAGLKLRQRAAFFLAAGGVDPYSTLQQYAREGAVKRAIPLWARRLQTSNVCRHGHSAPRLPPSATPATTSSFSSSPAASSSSLSPLLASTAQHSPAVVPNGQLSFARRSPQRLPPRRFTLGLPRLAYHPFDSVGHMSNPSDPPSTTHHDDYPLSPQSPSSLGLDHRRPKPFHSSQPQPPTSPAHSSSASVTASHSASPPYPAAFTPPSSVPMSAQTSQTSLSAAQTLASAARSNLQLDASQTPSTIPTSASTAMDIDSDPARPKRKLDETEEAETTPGKRTKLDESQALDETTAQDLSKPDFGPLYCLRNKDYALSRPHANQNLISLYGLDAIASSVARFDPNTGAKINRIRQSYEGYIKHLPGRAKLSSKKDKDDKDDRKKKSAEEDAEPVLWNVLQMPDEEYHIQRVVGKDISQGVPEDVMADLTSNLERATQMNVGRLPGAEDSNWRHIVTSAPAETKADKAKDAGLDRGKDEHQGQSISQASTSAANSPSAGAQNAGAEGDSSRARRNAKRRYNDDSYEGYGEGYEDDDGDVHSPDDADDPTGSLRRKKRKSTASSPRYPSFSGAYNSSSTVSVGYGSR